MIRRRASLLSGFGLVALCGSVLAIVSCGGDDNNGGGSGNAAGTSTGGSSTTGGTSQGGSFPSGGTSQGGTSAGASGSSGAGAGGAAGGAKGTPYMINIVVDNIRFLPGGGGGGGGAGGTGGGGAGGTGGASGAGAGGAAGTAGAGGAMSATCKATDALLTDFTMPTFGAATGLNGGSYVYPNTMAMPAPAFPLTGTVANGEWSITGTVGDYSGFGLYASCGTLAAVIDASEFKGVSFDIKGDAGPTGKVVFSVATAGNEATTATPATGRCTGAMCLQPSAEVAVTMAGNTYSFNWDQLTGGMPVATVTPTEILQLRWAVTWPPPATGGAGGAGGAAGAAGGGAGGTAGAAGGGAGGGAGTAGGGSGGGGAAGTSGAGNGGGGAAGTAGGGTGGA